MDVFLQTNQQSLPANTWVAVLFGTDVQQYTLSVFKDCPNSYRTPTNGHLALATVFVVN